MVFIKLPRHISLFHACLFIASTSSAIWSWTSLKALLISLGAFENLCTEETDGMYRCKAQENALSLYWNYSLSVTNIVIALNGHFFDSIGPRWSGVASQFLFGIGLVFMAVAQNFSEYLYFIGLVSIGIVQGPVMGSVMSVSTMFPHNINTVITIFSACGDASLIVFHAMYALHLRYGISARSLFIGYALLFCGSQALSAIFFLPPKALQHEAVEESGEKDAEVAVCEHTKLRSKSLKEQVLSIWFLYIIIYFNIHYFIQQFFMSELQNMLITAAHGDVNAAESYTRNVFVRFQSFSFTFVFINGYIMDHLGISASLTIHTLSALVIAIVSQIQILNIQWITALFYTLYMSNLFSCTYVYITECFGFAELNLLMALTTTPAFSSGLILGTYSFEGKHLPACVAFGSLAIVCLLVPLSLYRDKYHQKGNQLELPDETTPIVKQV